MNLIAKQWKLLFVRLYITTTLIFKSYKSPRITFIWLLGESQGWLLVTLCKLLKTSQLGKFSSFILMSEIATSGVSNVAPADIIINNSTDHYGCRLCWYSDLRTVCNNGSLDYQTNFSIHRYDRNWHRLCKNSNNQINLAMLCKLQVRLVRKLGQILMQSVYSHHFLFKWWFENSFTQSGHFEDI
jgi:hypothetical protein